MNNNQDLDIIALNTHACKHTFKLSIHILFRSCANIHLITTICLSVRKNTDDLEQSIHILCILLNWEFFFLIIRSVFCENDNKHMKQHHHSYHNLVCSHLHSVSMQDLHHDFSTKLLNFITTSPDMSFHWLHIKLSLQIILWNLQTKTTIRVIKRWKLFVRKIIKCLAFSYFQKSDNPPVLKLLQ
jgi:hypothetical protein